MNNLLLLLNTSLDIHFSVFQTLNLINVLIWFLKSPLHFPFFPHLQRLPTKSIKDRKPTRKLWLIQKTIKATLNKSYTFICSSIIMMSVYNLIIYGNLCPLPKLLNFTDLNVYPIKLKKRDEPLIHFYLKN